MKSPLLTALAVTTVALVLGFALPWAWRSLDPEAAERQTAAARAGAAPWAVETAAGEPGRSTVFGLRLPGSTLDEVQMRWGDGVRFAVVGASGPSDPGAPSAALEGHVERFTSGGVAGRLVLAFEARSADLARWQADHPGTPTGTGARRHSLSPAALDPAARQAALVGLTFLPSAGLDADTVRTRFGSPAARRVDAAGTEHWLYPATGLAVALPARGRAVLQYVAPADFERRLASPLATLPEPGATASSPGGSAAAR